MELIKTIQDNLSEDLLKPEYRGNSNPLFGHCYVAAETLYHMWGKDNGYQPHHARDINGIVHWWLQKDGHILDPTSGQYEDINPPYDIGKRGGFLTTKPSKRAQILIGRVDPKG